MTAAAEQGAVKGRESKGTARWIDALTPVRLSHASVPLSVSILPYGLTLHSMRLSPRDVRDEMISGSSDDDEDDRQTHWKDYSAWCWHTLLRSQEHELQHNYELPGDHAHPNRSFFAPIIGRYANRLPAGSQPVPLSLGSYEADEDAVEAHEPRQGATPLVTPREFSAPGVSLHGGPYAPSGKSVLPHIPQGTVLCQPGPFDRLVWSPISRAASLLFTDTSEAEGEGEDRLLAEQVFAVESPDGDQGYPGKLRVEVCFALRSGRGWRPAQSDAEQHARGAGALQVVYRAVLLSSADDPGKAVATPLNLTHHWGFNLSASALLSSEAAAQCGELDGTIDQHVLRFSPSNSDTGIQLLELDDKALPTGRLLPIPAGGEHDLSSSGRRRLGERMPEGGYDHYYFWGPPQEEVDEDPAGGQGALVHAPSSNASWQGDASSDGHSAARKTIGGSRTLLEQGERVRLFSDTTGLSISFRTDQTGVQVYTTNGQPASPDGAAAQAGGRGKEVHALALAVRRGELSVDEAMRLEQEGKAAEATATASWMRGFGNHARSSCMLEFGSPHATFLHKALRDANGSVVGDTVLRGKGEKQDMYQQVVVMQLYAQGWKEDACA